MRMNILVTGANRGLGLSFIKVGLENGHHMFAGVRKMKDSSINHLKELQKMYENRLNIVELDVTDENSVKEAAEHIEKTTDQLDCIINNAGMLNERDSIIEELDIEACMTAFNINTLGPIRVIKHFLRLLRNGDNQSIINISSDSASLTNAYSNDYPYGLSKVALNMLSEKLSVYLKDENIQVFSVHPGWMKTDMGGEHAPLNPVDSASQIFKIIEQDKPIKSPHTFIDYTGKTMDL